MALPTFDLTDPNVTIEESLPDELSVNCTRCGHLATYPAAHAGNAGRLRMSHARRHNHDCEPELDPSLKVIERAVTTRIAIRAALARIEMWRQHSLSDTARSADEVLAEVYAVLVDGD